MKNTFKHALFDFLKRFFLYTFLFSIFFGGLITHAQQPKFDNRATLTVSPQIGTFQTDSTFDVSIFLNTHGSKINTVDLNLQFSPDTLAIINPSSGTSLISLWTEPPRYSNTEGTATFSGGIPNGINTESGLLITVTFKAKKPGQGFVKISPLSKILAHDGVGTNILTGYGRATFSIEPKPPQGPQVFSETHQFQEIWYNNNNPLLAWEKEEGVNEYSLELDNKPQTIPDNTVDIKDTVKSYEQTPDGISYFHIKARKNGVWGGTTHFPLRIDTNPPAEFKPKVEVLTANIVHKALVSFFTTDSLSGIDRYEVGIIEKTKVGLESPVFLEVQSPYQLPTSIDGEIRVIVRAIDKAQNVQDAQVDVYIPLSSRLLMLGIIILFILLFIGHYLFGHHILAHFRRAFKIVREEEKAEHEHLPPTPPYQ